MQSISPAWRWGRGILSWCRTPPGSVWTRTGNEYLLLHGGHIGDGIRPSERGKGFATRMIALALEKCVELGLERVLMVCDQDNPASARTIVKNGGVLENEVMDEEGRWEQRYWIELTE